MSTSAAKSAVVAPPVRERPILFSGEMVRAILERRKSQTRRIAKIRKSTDHLLKMNPELWATRCPYGQPGDRLWVRETWAAFRGPDGRDVVAWRASCLDDSLDYVGQDGSISGLRIERWRPSIHMPRWASRIALEVTGVRVERLQDISKEDAVAEGARRFDSIPTNCPYPSSTPRWSTESPTHTDQCLGSPQMAFASLWNRINGPDSWDANPWVWVIEFKRIAKEHAA